MPGGEKLVAFCAQNAFINMEKIPSGRVIGICLSNMDLSGINDGNTRGLKRNYLVLQEKDAAPFCAQAKLIMVVQVWGTYLQGTGKVVGI